MIEYVFRPSRIVNGKRVFSRVFCGRYAFDKGMRPVQVSLNTPDREVARKRLRAIVLEKQREAEGIIAPKAVRIAAGTELAKLIDDYEADLRGRELDPKHVRDTTTRVRRMIADNGWKVLSDIRPDAFVKWRAGLKCSPKTKKEFHLSANAFLNWLVQTFQSIGDRDSVLYAPRQSAKRVNHEDATQLAGESDRLQQFWTIVRATTAHDFHKRCIEKDVIVDAPRRRPIALHF